MGTKRSNPDNTSSHILDKYCGLIQPPNDPRYRLRFDSNILVCGPGDEHHLVLLHGAGLTSTVCFANNAALRAHHRVYAVDIIGDASKSVADRLLKKRADYAHWLREVFDGLNIEKNDLLGHSYRGWLTLNMALAHPERLKKIVLLAPAASFRPLSFITKLFFFLGNS